MKCNLTICVFFCCLKEGHATQHGEKVDYGFEWDGGTACDADWEGLPERRWTTDDTLRLELDLDNCTIEAWKRSGDEHEISLGFLVRRAGAAGQELARQVGNGGTFCWYVELYSAGNEVTIGSVAAQ